MCRHRQRHSPSLPRRQRSAHETSMISTMVCGNGAVTKRFSKPNRNCSHFGFRLRSSCDFRRGSHSRSWSRAVQTRCVSSSSIIPTTQSFSSDTIALTERCCCSSWISRYPPIGDLRRSPAASMKSIAERRVCVVRMNETGHLAGIVRD
jgi:hypothetical protein